MSVVFARLDVHGKGFGLPISLPALHTNLSLRYIGKDPRARGFGLFRTCFSLL